MLNMRLYKRDNGIYYVSLPGEKRRSLKTMDRKTAIKEFKKIKRALIEGRLLNIDKKQLILIETFKTEYLKLREAKASNTYRMSRITLNKFIDFYGNRPMIGIKPKTLDQYKAHLLQLKLKTNTVNSYIRYLKIALNTARKWEYIEGNILEGFKQDKVDKSKPVFMSRKNVKTLLKKARDYDKKLIHDKVMITSIAIMYYTGMSRAEVCSRLHIGEDVIQYKRVKTKKLISAPIGKNLRPFIKHLRPGIQRVVPWKHVDTYSHHFKKVVDMTALEGISPHKVRHTFASHLLDMGEDLKTISELLGHEDIRITADFYTHLTKEKKQRAVDKL